MNIGNHLQSGSHCHANKYYCLYYVVKTDSVTRVHKRPPLVGEVSADFSG
jgi:hypothetical protein